MKIKMLAAVVLSVMLSMSVQAAEKVAEVEKPGAQEVAMLTLDATVSAIDKKAGKVTLKNDEGETKTFTLKKDAAEKLEAVEVGDTLTIQYVKSVSIEVLDENVDLGVDGAVISADSAPGEKPAALAATEVSIVVSIEAIDLEKKLVTLKAKNGEVETVEPLNPENLKKVKVGERVKITYTEAIGYSVTKKAPVAE